MKKHAGTSLLIFAVLLLFTMVMHPTGGSIEYLIRIKNAIIVSHTLALMALPFGWLGFRGLTRTIGQDRFESVMAFGMASLGLVAAMIAGATNGLILPIYLDGLKVPLAETIESVKPILRYGLAVNHAFDYIYTFAFCGAILCWSVGILLTSKLPKWLGWAGIIASVAIAAIFIFGIAVQNLNGLRFFAAIVVLWSIMAGYLLPKVPEAGNSNYL